MRDQIIELVKKYRAESEKCWTPNGGYRSHHHQGQSYTYSKCADDLEELLRELTNNSHRDNLRIGITKRHDLNDQEGDISNAAWQLHLKQKAEAMRVMDEEWEKRQARMRVIPNTHTARIVKGRNEW